MSQPTPAQLLRDSGSADEYVHPVVRTVIRQLFHDGRLATPGDSALLAIASLGSTQNIMHALIATGSIPHHLNEIQIERLSARTGLTADDLENPSKISSAVPQIASFLGLPQTAAEAEKAPPPLASAAYPLFAHQRKALRKVNEILTSGGVVLLHMPTGSGKTRTAMNAVCEMLRKHEGKSILWVATMGELLDQAAFEFQKAWSSLGDRNSVPVTLAYGSRDWHVESIGGGIIFGTPQTIRGRHDKMMRESQSSLYALLAERTSLIVFDEAHQSTAATYMEVLQGVARATYPNIPVLGLSATPGRTYLGSNEDFALIDLFEGTKVTLDTTDSGYDNPVDYLIGNGYLARPEFRLLGDLPGEGDGAIVSPMTTTEYVKFVTTAALDLIDEGHVRTIVFARSVDESDIIAACLRAAGIAAASVNGNTPDDQRDTAAREYKAQGTTPRVLVNFGVYTAGFDAPATSAVIIARPVRSLVSYSQMVGRGIRGLSAGGNENAVIATVVDPTEPAFGNIATAFTNWNSMWE